MASHLPLLVFPRARTIPPPKGRGGFGDGLYLPRRARQAKRLEKQLDDLQDEFSRYKASVSGVVSGLEPETVLVIEIVGSVRGFKRAVMATDGLEWLGEWEVEDIEPTEEFYKVPKVGVDFFKNRINVTREESRQIRQILLDQKCIDKYNYLIVDDIPPLPLPDNLENQGPDILAALERAKSETSFEGCLFLSFSSERGLNELLKLWRLWQQEKALPFGQAKWRNVFSRTRNIRRWGIEETLKETGMIDRWRELVRSAEPAERIRFQIELFYRQSPEKRRQTEKVVTALLDEIGGRRLSAIDMSHIEFHAVMAELPADQVRRLVDKVDASSEANIMLFRFPGIMYFRPAGQSLAALGDEGGVAVDFPEGDPQLQPVAAILDGVPNLHHKALRNRLLFDDPDNLVAEYQPGERRHGTAMASLVVHGGQLGDKAVPLQRKVYHRAILQPDPSARPFGECKEYIPHNIFLEDRIERAVRRMFEGEGNVPAQAPDVKIINLSVCEPERPFTHTLSPWARLLDWLSFKYRVLFCVSAGNFEESLDMGITYNQFSTLPDDEKVLHTLRCIERQLSQRRLLSPAESLNALTVGALHADAAREYTVGRRIDLLPNNALPSPASRIGYGFRRSIKPEVLFPGGRQLYKTRLLGAQQYDFCDARRAPGIQVAYDSAVEGELSHAVFSCGTSNATALATHNGAKIGEMLLELQAEFGAGVLDRVMAVLIKALLVHAAGHSEGAERALTKALKTPKNSRRFKEVMARYIGYGAVDIERVLACTEQRATVIGGGEIKGDEVHEYRFPLPPALSGMKVWRRMIVTLAWFSPINPAHRWLREARLAVQPFDKWGATDLKLKRVDSDHNQVLRGTVQHEVLIGERQIAAYMEDGHIQLRITCRPEATEKLDEVIPYGLAVTLEVADGINIPIYEQIRARIKPRVVVGAPIDS